MKSGSLTEKEISSNPEEKTTTLCRTYAKEKILTYKKIELKRELFG